MSAVRMKPSQRAALEQLESFEWAWLTNEETQVVRREDGDELLMNNGTAGALVRRGLATFVDDDDEDRHADIVSIVKMPVGAQV